MALRQLENALALLGSLDPGNLPIHHARVLVWLAQREHATYREIETECGLSNAAVSRTLNSLAEESPHRKHTLGLVEIYRDAMSGRRYKARLNRKGREFMRALEGLLETNPRPTHDQSNGRSHQEDTQRLGC
jgi:DNA-binding MarR family transcriptional regulator